MPGSIACLDANKDERIADVEFVWRCIRPGRFNMGSPQNEPERDDDETLHQVQLTRSFLMGETEVTQGQWQKLMGNNPSRFKACGTDCPVESVNWFEAAAFANTLSKRSNLEECYDLVGDIRHTGGTPEYQKASFRGLDCKGYRLPTEAEWEYAARATTTAPFWTGDNLTTRQANYDGNSPYAGQAEGVFRRTTVEVRSFDANRWGLYGVHGNVSEWTQDAADLDDKVIGGVKVMTRTYVDGKKNPLSDRGSQRVVRGGSWRSAARNCRAAFRDLVAPGDRYESLGFRLVRTLH